jgi:hypothetical protein
MLVNFASQTCFMFFFRGIGCIFLSFVTRLMMFFFDKKKSMMFIEDNYGQDSIPLSIVLNLSFDKLM